MKINKLSNGKTTVSLTPEEWKTIGKKAGFFPPHQADHLKSLLDEAVSFYQQGDFAQLSSTLYMALKIVDEKNRKKLPPEESADAELDHQNSLRQDADDMRRSGKW